MDDRLVLARTVGVFDAGLHYRAELRRLDQRHRQRMDYWLGGVMFGVLFGVFTLLAYIVGVWHDLGYVEFCAVVG